MNIDDMLPPRPPGLTDEEWLDVKIETLESCEREGIIGHTGEYELFTYPRMDQGAQGARTPTVWAWSVFAHVAEFGRGVAH
jgi:hypothetical protein